MDIRGPFSVIGTTYLIKMSLNDILKSTAVSVLLICTWNIQPVVVDSDSQRFRCGEINVCESLGHDTCVEVDDGHDCYPCYKFKDTCGQSNQRDGCHLYCQDVLLKEIKEKCNKELEATKEAEQNDTESDTSSSSKAFNFREASRDQTNRAVLIWAIISTVLALGLGIALGVVVMNRWRQIGHSDTENTAANGTVPRNLSALTVASGSSSTDTNKSETTDDEKQSLLTENETDDKTPKNPNKDGSDKVNMKCNVDGQKPYCEQKLKNVNPSNKDEPVFAPS